MIPRIPLFIEGPADPPKLPSLSLAPLHFAMSKLDLCRNALE